MMKKVVLAVSALATAAHAEDYDWGGITEDFISGYVRGLQAAPGVNGTSTTNAPAPKKNPAPPAKPAPKPAPKPVAECKTFFTGEKCKTQMRASTTPANIFNYVTKAGKCKTPTCVDADASACCEKKAHSKADKFTASLDIGLVATGTASAVNSALTAAGGKTSAVAATMAAAIKDGLMSGDSTAGAVVTCTSISAADFTAPSRRSLAERRSLDAHKLVKINGKFAITGLTAKQAYVAKAAAGGDSKATAVVGNIGKILATKLADPATLAAFATASGMSAKAIGTFAANLKYASVVVVVTDASGAAVTDLAALKTAGGLTDADVTAIETVSLGVTTTVAPTTTATPTTTVAPTVAPTTTAAPTSSAFTAGAGFFTLASAFAFSMF